MVKNYIPQFLFILICLPLVFYAQEVKIFTLKDFDLKDSVKTCLVSTSYGKEEYDFNLKGVLTKSVTRYNEADYDVVYYKYQNDELIEKRSESYRNNTFDPSTSIAHFYKLDTLNNVKVTEKIVSYEEEFLDQYVYHYDDKGDLVKIIRTNNDGIDETLIEYKKYKGEYTVTYLINNEPLKSIRTSQVNKKNGTVQKIVLTKEYLKGEANKAFEEVFNEKGLLVAQQEFEYNIAEKTFVPTKRTTYTYDDNDMLVGEASKNGDEVMKKEYVYQYDREGEGNWIKQIVRPENTYKTRKITYYVPEVVEK
ncbi:hypothetical protein EJ994_06380 [Maribacter sp. MJ134]|uniref:hypothetical protein n=1 Tax=Maribacter sp. MJ134 TaxID=2496865 RepID=UPI000F82250B|nr:hypothetical protein [Maribacter sp. MJ134]AZQ58451.1 hypothetical protein EJ994_06380 [Maribacter sp. MJ134]